MIFGILSITLGIALFSSGCGKKGEADLPKANKKSGGSGAVSSPGIRNKTGRQLITDYAKGRHGRRADVLIESGFYGGAYQVTVKVPIESGNYAGGYDSFSYTATVDEKAQKITSWKLTDHN